MWLLAKKLCVSIKNHPRMDHFGQLVHQVLSLINAPTFLKECPTLRYTWNCMKTKKNVFLNKNYIKVNWSYIKEHRHSKCSKLVAYLKALTPRCLTTLSNTKTSFPCSCNLNVFASTSLSILLKCSLSTLSKWQLCSFSTIVAALKLVKGKIFVQI